MPKITYIAPDGAPHEVDVESGSSVMQGAVNNNVPGIAAECGGACACATCHVYVDEAWLDKAGAAAQGERDMIEFALHVQPNSRLSCQITVSDALDGLVVRIPPAQS